MAGFTCSRCAAARLDGGGSGVGLEVARLAVLIALFAVWLWAALFGAWHVVLLTTVAIVIVEIGR